MWCKQTLDSKSTESSELASRPFRSRHEKQIQLIKDFSWLNIDALDGIEDEFARILKELVEGTIEFADRHEKLCRELRKRIEVLRAIVNKQTKNRVVNEWR